MGVERARVVEVRSAASAAGYLIGERLVLTAGDVVGPAGTAEVRIGGTVTWYTGVSVWASGAAAIVEIDEPLAVPAFMRWGDVSGPRPVPVTAMGFPTAGTRSRPFRDAEQFFGQLRSGRVDPAPASRMSGEGLHGAALFAGAELIGVVTARGDTLKSMPVSAFATDPAFVEVMGPVELVPVRVSTGGFSIL